MELDSLISKFNKGEILLSDIVHGTCECNKCNSYLSTRSYIIKGNVLELHYKCNYCNEVFDLYVNMHCTKVMYS
jgi:transposase-like protein